MYANDGMTYRAISDGEPASTYFNETVGFHSWFTSLKSREKYKLQLRTYNTHILKRPGILILKYLADGSIKRVTPKGQWFELRPMLLRHEVVTCKDVNNWINSSVMWKQKFPSRRFISQYCIMTPSFMKSFCCIWSRRVSSSYLQLVWHRIIYSAILTYLAVIQLLESEEESTSERLLAVWHIN